MSCHDIGRGMASVGKVVLRLYDEGKYDYDTAYQLLQATIKGVHWCDGNEHEAAASFSGRCAYCLKATESPKDDLIFGTRFFAEASMVYGDDNISERADSEFVLNLYWKNKLLAAQLCKNCFEKFHRDMDSENSK